MKKRFLAVALLLLLVLLALFACRAEGNEGSAVTDNGTAETPGDPGTETPTCAHMAVGDAAVAPTCTEEGKTAGEHCALCGEVLTEQTVLPPLGHTPGAAKDAVTVTCTRWGATGTAQCVRCRATLQEQTFLPPAGHRFEQGKCTACGEETPDYTDPARYTSDEGYRYFATTANGSAMVGLYNEMEKDLLAFHNSSTRNAPFYRRKSGVGDLYRVAGYNYDKYSLTLEEAQTVYAVFRKDHPLYYWLSYYLYWDNNNLYVMTEKEFAKGQDRSKVNQTVYEGIETYASLADGETSAYNIALIYYEAILGNNSYAYDSNGDPEPAQWAHSIAGAFLYQEMVCEGYAKLFQFLLTFSGVENVYVVGDAGGMHCWNLARMDDGNWYWFDPTWGDTGADPYLYFCVTDSAMETHTPTPEDQYGMYFNHILPQRAQAAFSSSEFPGIGETITADGGQYIRCAWNTLKPVGAAPQREMLIYRGTIYRIAAA